MRISLLSEVRELFLMDSVNLSESLGGYHSKTMGLGSSYFANFTSARNGCIEHGLRDRWGVRSKFLWGYHSKTMGLGLSYFANFTSARNGCIEHGLRDRWGYP